MDWKYWYYSLPLRVLIWTDKPHCSLSAPLFPHRLTVLAGKDDLRAPSAVYHISWYPGANSCLVKDNTSSDRVLCRARYSISQESNNMEQQRLVEKHLWGVTVGTCGGRRFSPAAHSPLNINSDGDTLQKPDGFEDSDKAPLTDKRIYKEECWDFNELHMFFSWMVSFTWTGVGEENFPTLGVLSLFVCPDHFIRQSYYLCPPMSSVYLEYVLHLEFRHWYTTRAAQEWLINQGTSGETFILLG